jgi:G:T-mismatch repair DNA endonuclease (very short patch repair protein)
LPRRKYKQGVKGVKGVKPGRAPRNKLPAKAIRKAQKHRKRSSIELKVYDWLKEEKIPFVKEKSIGRCHADVFLEPNIVIELQGCYYHKCPTHHPAKTKEDQLVLSRDRARFAFFRSRGHQIYQIWECEINKCPESTRAKLVEIWKNRKK